MENSVIGHLCEIRSNLQCAVRASEKIENKILGPRPCDPSTPKPSQECISSLLSEVTSLSVQLLKILGNNDEILGEFGSAQTAPARLA